MVTPPSPDAAQAASSSLGFRRCSRTTHSRKHGWQSHAYLQKSREHSERHSRYYHTRRAIPRDTAITIDTSWLPVHELFAPTTRASLLAFNSEIIFKSKDSKFRREYDIVSNCKYRWRSSREMITLRKYRNGTIDVKFRRLSPWCLYTRMNRVKYASREIPPSRNACEWLIVRSNESIISHRRGL